MEPNKRVMSHIANKKKDDGRNDRHIRKRAQYVVSEAAGLIRPGNENPEAAERAECGILGQLCLALWARDRHDR